MTKEQQDLRLVIRKLIEIDFFAMMMQDLDKDHGDVYDYLSAGPYSHVIPANVMGAARNFNFHGSEIDQIEHYLHPLLFLKDASWKLAPFVSLPDLGAVLEDIEEVSDILARGTVQKNLTHPWDVWTEAQAVEYQIEYQAVSKFIELYTKSHKLFNQTPSPQNLEVMRANILFHSLDYFELDRIDKMRQIGMPLPVFEGNQMIHTPSPSYEFALLNIKKTYRALKENLVQRAKENKRMTLADASECLENNGVLSKEGFISAISLVMKMQNSVNAIYSGQYRPESQEFCGKNAGVSLMKTHWTIDKVMHGLFNFMYSGGK